MGIAASSSSPPPSEPAGGSAAPPPPTAEPVAASTPPTEAAAPPPPPSTEAANPPDKHDAAADAGADVSAETVVVDVAAEAAKEGEEEEEGECGFCLFMKGGGCKEEFIAWEKCVEEAEADGKKEDVVERCHDATAALRKCMDAHADYYEPILRAERAMAEDLEAAQAREASGTEPTPSSSAEAPAQTSEEEGQKKQADEVADSDKKDGDSEA